jgi:lipopolysaccharide export system protein LptA
MKRLIPLAILALASAAAAPACAQFAQNSSAPIRADADELKTENNGCIATYTGNVEVLQDTARLRTDLMKVFAQPGGKSAKPTAAGGGGSCGALTRIEAHGSVYYVTPQQRVHGDDAVYDAASDTITVTGDVVAVQDRNVLKGTRMVINNQTGEGHMEGETKGRNQPGRVSTVIYPQDKNGQPKPASGGKPR